MSLAQQAKLTPEERQKMREKCMIQKKENETIYRHYGELNGTDFKLRNNKNCEIYILDWSKGMFIDYCEDCKIFCGPIDGSIFIRNSKNCQISLVAKQVRFRDCENIKIFTYCTSDPAVENSFNIYFAPFNAFFPHLKELFLKGEFKKEENNHINTPYDFTPNQELGGGAPHFLKLPEEEFFIKVINDNDEQVEELYDGYSQEEPWIQNKSSELPSFEPKREINNDNNDVFNFMGNNDNEDRKIIDNDNQQKSQEVLNDFITSPSNNENNSKNNDNLMNDFFSDNQMNTNNKINSDSNSNNNNNFMDMNDFFGGSSNNNNQSQQKESIEFNNFNMNNNQNNNSSNNYFINDSNNFNSFNNKQISKETEEEIKLEEIRNKQKEMRQEKIRQKMEKEAKMKMEIIAKASEYMRQFYEERKKRIAMNHEKLMQSSNQGKSDSSGNPWGMVQSTISGSSSSADRMKEVIMNKNNQQFN